MPLVVPGINSGGDDKNAQWMNKLMGKKLGNDHDQTVRPRPLSPSLCRSLLGALVVVTDLV
jgi:hypothetical protein